jgi:hypothetical protein
MNLWKVNTIVEIIIVVYVDFREFLVSSNVFQVHRPS